MKEYDLLVIGGGLIGCSIAWQSARRGMSVLVVERGDVGREATHAAGGMLAPLSEADQDDPFLQLCRQSLALYAGFAQTLQQETGIDVEYWPAGTLYLSLTGEDDEELESRHRWQSAAGLRIERLTSAEVLAREPALNPELRWALRFPDDHQVNNRHLIRALQSAARLAGVEFYTQTAVRRLLIESHGGEQRAVGVVTDRGDLKASTVVLAAGSWSSQLLDTVTSQPGAPYQVVPVRGQMVAVEMPRQALRHVIYSRRGYLVPRRDGMLIAGSTTELVGYDRRLTPAGIASIVGRAEEIMPAFVGQPVLEMWAGLRPRSADLLPVLGADPVISGLIHATGHYRNGVLLAPLTGQLVADLVTGTEPAIDLAPFSPARFVAVSG